MFLFIIILFGNIACQKQKNNREKKDPGLLPKEKKLIADLENSVFDGHWHLVTKGIKIGAAKKEKYGIKKISKVKGDQWTIEANIKFNAKRIKRKWYY